MNWKEEAIKRLDALAAKLGTTSSYLWSVLLKQAIAQGVADCITAAVCAGVVIGCGLLFRWSYKNGVADDWDSPAWAVTCIISPLIAVGFFVGFIVNLQSGVMELYNPAYYAVSSVLQAVK